MAGGIVTVASGVINPLIGKLTTLMGDEYKKFKGVRKQAPFLQKELNAMNAALHKLELIDEIDPTVKDWRDDVREMPYDMENCIDDFIRQSRADNAKGGFIKKTARCIKKLRERIRIAHQMEDLKTLALDAKARHERYAIDDWKPASGSVVVDPRLRAVYQEADALVGIDGPREEIAMRLMDTQKKIKVVAIVGFGGLGKTTLSKQVYDKIDLPFNCKAFFSVSQRPHMAELLNNFQLKLGMNSPSSSHTRKVEDMIEEIRGHLNKKRYLIIIDDVWDESSWNILKCALREDNNGSRIIVTTRLVGVASAACQNDSEGIYRLKPLNEQNSRMLFLNRIFGSEHDREISRDDLVRQWITEGLLVRNLHVTDLENLGRSYFNELVNRSIIDPCRTKYGEVLSFRVHDIMLDFILSKCDEDNFISLAHNCEDMASLHDNKYKVRRLSMRGAKYGPIIDVSLSQVRSFTQFGKFTPPPSLFKYLRIFRIEGFMESLDLTAIGELFQLRYLYVSGIDSVQLPAELQGLVYLGTLDLHDAQIKSMPSDIVSLSRLSYLRIWMETELPEFIGNIKSLRSLMIYRNKLTSDPLSNSMKVIIGLGELTNLRELKIDVGSLEKPERDALACSIGKLSNLKNLRFIGYPNEDNNQLGSLSKPFQNIEQFHGPLWKFCRVPVWMGGLHYLRILELSVEETSTEEFHVLGELPSLLELKFRSSHIPKERAVLGTGLFPVLEDFNFWSIEDVTAYLRFDEGAMPNVRTLALHNKEEWDGSIPVGMEYLLCLEKIQLHGAYSGDDAIVSAFRSALLVHPNRPSVQHWRREKGSFPAGCGGFIMQ
ncbi:disease resistance protein RGA5-like [Triticum dicoccoides]|uniref:disease resistance protein RGA5-like n=1 Tax=Triticum dicoccoides TaxID=85692 RepID=UPI00188F25CD|nr:disease resistance protein RGA5-like [Triticum dicoccoides]